MKKKTRRINTYLDTKTATFVQTIAKKTNSSLSRVIANIIKHHAGITK